MKIALTTICPDARQRAFLGIVRPTWEAYAKRHDLPIIVVENPPHPENVFWGKYFALTLPEFAKYDAVIALDNDILVNPHSPLVTEDWDGSKIGIADERQQFDWDDAFVAQYYSHYEHEIPARVTHVGILNTGVLLYTRAHLPFFEAVHARWVEWRDRATAATRETDSFKYANDQPHVSLALQVADRAKILPPAYNRLWWSWYRQRGTLPWRAFQGYAKASSLFEEFAPRALASAFARPGARAIERGLSECHFLHVAGSKSPIWLFAHRSSA